MTTKFFIVCSFRIWEQRRAENWDLFRAPKNEISRKLGGWGWLSKSEPFFFLDNQYGWVKSEIKEGRKISYPQAIIQQ